MARKSIVGCIPNFAEITSFVTAYAKSEASGFEVENLLDLRPSLPWRSASVAPTEAVLSVGVNDDMQNFFRPESNLFGVLPTNLWRESGRFRIVGCEVAATPTPSSLTEVLPNGLGADNTGTGAVTTIDEGFGVAADGSFITLTSGQTLHAQFDDPVEDPIADEVGNTGRQMFAVEIEVTAETAPGAIRAHCKLYEADVETLDLGYKFLPVGLVGRGSFVLIWTWDAADLLTADGSLAEIWFRVTGADVRVHRVAWDLEGADQFAGDSPLFDTGWVTAWPALGGSYVSEVRPEEESFPPYALHLAAAGVTYTTLKSFIVMFCDDQLPTVQVDGSGFLTTAHVPRFPDGYIEAGVAIWGLGLELPRGCKFGPAAKVIDSSPTSRTPGGQLLAAGRPKRRAVYCDANALPPDVLAALMDRIDLVKGVTRPVLFLPNPDNAIESQLFNIYGTQQDPTQFMRLETSTPLYGKAYVFEEYR